MVKILFYYDSMHPKGGVERVISNLINNLIEEFDITLLTCDDTFSSYPLPSKIKFISMYKKRYLDMNKSRLNRIYVIIKSIISNHFFLKKIIKEFEYVYIATPLTSLEVFLLGKKYRSKIVVSEHASYFACNKIYNMIRKAIYPKFKVISVPTKLDTRLYQEIGCNSVYIPHLKTFETVKETKIYNKIAINVGRLTSDKQQLLLLKIWNNIYKKNLLNGWVLRIVGEGELRNDLDYYIKENKLESCVFLIGNSPNIEEEYNNSNLFLFTSKMEGFGMVLLEAMAFGLPCISFDCHSGPRDIIKDGENGFLIEENDILKFEKKIIELINDYDKLNEMSNSAKTTINNWNNKEIIEEWKKIFKKEHI